MSLGYIQERILAYLSRTAGGGVICSTTQASEFSGLDLEQVENSLKRLSRRGIIRREGIRWVLTEKGRWESCKKR